MRTEARASPALLLAVCGLAFFSAKVKECVVGTFPSDVHAYDLISSASCSLAVKAVQHRLGSTDPVLRGHLELDMRRSDL